LTTAIPAVIALDAAPATRAETASAPVALPRNWYMLAESREVSRGKLVTRKIADREIALFRTQAGVLAAFDGHCAHMGCHLRHAAVIGENLRCALHFRHIDKQGRFLRPDGTPSPDLRQPTYPVAERHGMIFVHVGGEPKHDLPMPDIVSAEEFMARPAGEFRTDTPWYALIANGFDMEHLLSVHQRELKEEAQVSYPDTWSYRIAYRTAVTGTSLADRVMKRMSRNDIRASMTVISGTTMLVQSHAGPSPSIFILSMCPQEGGETLVRGIVGLKAGRSRILDGLKLRLAQWLFKSFLARDYGIFEGLQWHPPAHRHSSGDRFTHQLYNYFMQIEGAGPAPSEGFRTQGIGS
jgi:phenylpropionate dioxygenase-like ring-hydroxylating dioxygenase large terminal subunit